MHVQKRASFLHFRHSLLGIDSTCKKMIQWIDISAFACRVCIKKCTNISQHY